MGASRMRYLVSVVGLVVVAGCGSSSTSTPAAKAPASTPATPNTASTAPTPSGPPLSKAAYGDKVRREVDADALPALRTWSKDPTNLGLVTAAAASIVRTRAKIAALTPPASIATLHEELLSSLQRESADFRALATALSHHDSAAERAAGQRISQDGQEQTTLSQKAKAAGVNIG
jgi:hypothetical protein